MGVYAEFDDVADRFEGDMPDDREDWVELRIDDVEDELSSFAPTFFVDRPAMEPRRVGRIKRLICDKILALYRNPDGALTISATAGTFSESRTLPGSRTSSGSWVAFTDDELARIGYPQKRSSAGSVKLRANHYDDRRYDDDYYPHC